jgi:small GTP-binding protein
MAAADAGLTITYSADALEQELLAAAEDFAASLQQESVSRLLSRGVMSEILAAQRSIKEHLASTFSIMVAGDFKRGKSTLINALLGQAVAPVDVQPETITINRIEYAESPQARLQTMDGGQVTVPAEDLKRERLEPLLKKLSTPLRNLRLGVPVDLLKRVTIIDTPGLGDLFKEFDPLVRESIAQADTVIYVLSALSPLSGTEQDFLQSSVLPRHFPKMFFVVNAVDALNSAQDEQRLMDLIREKLNRLMPGAHVYALSALDEWSRVSGGARPNAARAESLEKAFGAFRHDLESAIGFRQRYYTLDRAAYAFGESLAMTEQRAEGLRQALQHDQEQLDTAVHAIGDWKQTQSTEFTAASDALEKGFEDLRREADGWMSQFLDRFEKDALPKMTTLHVPQIQQYLPFFLKDRLGKAIEACLLAHEPEIARLFERYTTGMADDVKANVQLKGLFDNPASVADTKWSNMQTAQIVADFLQLGLIAQVGLAIFSRQTQISKSGQVIETLAKSIPDLRLEVRNRLRDAYSQVKQALLKDWTARHDQQLQEHLADLQQAVAVRERGAGQVTGAQQTLADLSEIVAAKQAFLEQFKPKVWSGLELTEPRL